MNKKALVTFLRQLLCLFVVIKLVGGVMSLIATRDGQKLFETKQILPDNLFVPHRAVFITINLLFTYIGAISVYCICTSLIGFFGVIYMETRQLLNFSFGMSMLLMCHLELNAARSLGLLSDSLAQIVLNRTQELFATSYQWNPELMKNTSYEKNNSARFLAEFRGGWNTLSSGSTTNHSDIDYIQLTLECCGLHGRDFWEASIPRSCCPYHFRGDKCVLSVAHSKGCIFYYQSFDNAVGSLKVELVLFGLMSLAAAADSLYLTYMQVLHPDGEFKSESTTETEDDSF